MKKKIGLFLAGLIIAIICILLFLNHSYKSSIKNKVSEMGGEVTSIESSVFMNDPFPWYEHSKNNYIYKFHYRKNDKEYIGYVNFGAFKTKWILDL